MIDRSQRRNVPRRAVWRRRRAYFTAADIETITREVRLPLAHDTGAAIKILDSIANSFLLNRQLAGAETERERAEWAARVDALAAALLKAFGRARGHGADIDMARRLAEADNPRLAKLARIVARGDLAGADRGNPVLTALRGVTYLRELATTLAERERRNIEAAKKEGVYGKRPPDSASVLLGEQLHDAFVAIFGARPTVWAPRRAVAYDSPVVRFAKAFARILAPLTADEGPAITKLLSRWALPTDNALGDRIKDRKA